MTGDTVSGPGIIPESVPLPELDRRYFAYVGNLPPPLNSLALDRRLFIGKGKSQAIDSLQDVHPLVTSLPWLFCQAFPTVREVDLLDISEAGTLLIMGLLLHDSRFDAQLPSYSGITLLYQQFNIAAVRKFQQLFEAQSSFWVYFDQYLCHYTIALLQEREHRGQVIAYPMEKMYEIGSGKIALFKAITTGLAVKSKAEKHIFQLEAAVDALGAAMQLADDIEDWAEDYQCKNYTLPLTRAIPTEQWPVPSLSVAEIGQRLEDSVIVERLIQQIIKWFHQALDAVSEIPCPDWVEFIGSYLARVERYQRSLVAKKLIRLMSSKKCKDEI